MGKASATKKTSIHNKAKMSGAYGHSAANLQSSTEVPQSPQPSMSLHISALHPLTPPVSTKHIQQDEDLSVAPPAEQSHDVGRAVHTALHQSRWHLWDSQPSIRNQNQERATQGP